MGIMEKNFYYIFIYSLARLVKFDTFLFFKENILEHSGLDDRRNS